MFGKRRLLWKIYPLFLFVTLATLAAITWVATGQIRSFHLESTGRDLKARAQFLERYIHTQDLFEQREEILRHCNDLGKQTGTRITIILNDGAVLADSHKAAASMDNHVSRPEIRQAIERGHGQEVRYSQTLRQNMMYVAIPFYWQDRLGGVIRTSLPVTAIEDTLSIIYVRIAISAGIILLFAAGVSLFLAQGISMPLEEMRRGAERFKRGELESRLPVTDTEEIGALAESMNSMAYELNERINTITHERGIREAVLSSMVECVLAIDGDERVLHLNQAAADLFKTTPIEGEGRTVHEVVRISMLLRFALQSLEEGGHDETEISLYEGEEKILKVRACPLMGREGRRDGILLVLRDVTKLRRLERMRQEFVSNVSHELRTPITSIKGFVETLIDSELTDEEEMRRFLAIVGRQADRLGAIIEDLLSLSRIEREEKRESEFLPVPLVPMLEAAIQTCQVSAEKSQVNLVLEAQAPATIQGRENLLEQAVINLIGNAIKYSEADTSVQVRLHRDREAVEISVTDCGCGIEAEHLPRLFERFYRVDKARSRQAGGTGLGLAIVKHVAQLHHGTVAVQSTPGKGSTFTIALPIA
ncbi:MAG: two-component system histidine kinase PnpS [Planctomycetota bacterium]|jgi:two-component system phosphate regulon sensor histidine kinase PhoR